MVVVNETHVSRFSNEVLKQKNTSGYIGVYRSSKTCKKNWVALITHEGNKYHIGYFNDPREAARARDRKAIKLRGENAELNFPLSSYQNTPTQPSARVMDKNTAHTLLEVVKRQAMAYIREGQESQAEDLFAVYEEMLISSSGIIIPPLRSGSTWNTERESSE